MEELTSLSIFLTNLINPVTTHSEDIWRMITGVESNLERERSIFLSEAKKKNWRNCQIKLGKEQWKNLITFDANGEVKLKDDFLLLSNKETLDKIIRKAKVCIDPILPEEIKKLFEGLTLSKQQLGKTFNIPITTYKNLFEYINTTITQLLKEDVEEIKASIYRDIALIIRGEKSTQILHRFRLDANKNICIEDNVLKSSGAEQDARLLMGITSDILKQAFKICNITSAQEKDIMAYLIGKRIDKKIGFEKLYSIGNAKNLGKILKSSVELFNSCSQIYLEDIPKIIKFKYDVFIKTFDLLWDEFLLDPYVRDNFFGGRNYIYWRYAYYEKNKEDWEKKYGCIIWLHRHAATILQDYASKLNKNLLTKLCLDEIEAMNIDKERQKSLQARFWESLNIYNQDLPQACQIVRLYQKGIEINKMHDINQRIAIISEREFYHDSYDGY